VIIDRYLFKETIFTWLSVLLVLLLIFCSKHFVRYMSDAAAGELPTAMIIQLLSLFTISYLALLIPFAFYLAIIITLGRLYKENEITAAEACGIGIPRITKSIFQLSLALALLVGILSLGIAPWAEYSQYEIRNQAKSEAELSFISPGKFHEIRGNRGVFYIEEMSANNSQMMNLFVQIKENNKTDIFTSRTGFLKRDEASGDYFLVMKDGFRFEYFSNGGFRQHQYEESGVRIYQSSMDGDINKIIAQSTAKLISMDGNESMAEIQWRLSMPISCVLLALIAVLLSRTGPRDGRFGKLFLALLVYIAYVYSLMASKSLLGHGEIPAFVGLLWPHIIALMLIVYLAKNQFGKTWLMMQLGFKRQGA